MNHYIKVLNAPSWAYWFFWILPIFVAYPAVISYKIITQLDIFPRYLKLIELQLYKPN